MKLLPSNKPWLALAVGVAVVGTSPWLVSEFVASVLLSCLMYIALATSWSLFCGATRYLSLATSAFFGIGAYTSATLLAVLPWPLVILAGALIATVVAVVMGAAVLHLRGTYFAVLTFGMTELIRHAVTFVEKQVSGTVGRVLTVVPSNETVYLTVLLIALIGGATSIGGPILAAIVFSLLAETLRLQLPYGYMMVLGLLLILCVMYLPNGLATLWQRRKPAEGAHHG